MAIGWMKDVAAGDGGQLLSMRRFTTSCSEETMPGRQTTSGEPVFSRRESTAMDVAFGGDKSVDGQLKMQLAWARSGVRRNRKSGGNEITNEHDVVGQ